MATAAKNKGKRTIEELVPVISIATAILSVGIFVGTTIAAMNRLDKLEEATTPVSGKLNTIDESVKDLKNRVDKHQEEMMKLSRDVGRLEGNSKSKQ